VGGEERKKFDTTRKKIDKASPNHEKRSSRLEARLVAVPCSNLREFIKDDAEKSAKDTWLRPGRTRRKVTEAQESTSSQRRSGKKIRFVDARQKDREKKKKAAKEVVRGTGTIGQHSREMGSSVLGKKAS